MAYRAIAAGCAVVVLSAGISEARPPIEAMTVTPARVRAQPGDSVEFRIHSPDVAGALLLVPGGGTRPVTLETVSPGLRRAIVKIPADGAPGFYLLHLWSGDREHPDSVGKASILAGQVRLDFALPAYVDRTNPARDLAAYLDDFQSFGGNTLVAHALITPDRAWFPSTIARTPLVRGSPDDFVERLLTEADRRGLAVLLSVSWDMTHKAPYRDRMTQITSLMDEMFSLYVTHPSLAGFYSYQEGSGTYYVPYVREFTAHVKTLNPGLLSACAPFVDDPLLAGYLSTVDTLDVTIFQGQVMGSYRPDNRKKYPLRRVRDFAALGVGAKYLQDKIAITHVELFGYLEHRPDPAILAASYDNILGQLQSVATTAGADGIALFAYHPHIWSARRDARVQRSRQAVIDGLEAFGRAQRAIGTYRNPLAVYVPYSDWIVERWTTSILPGLDGFRRAGIPVDILPYAPPIEESVYPYFPFHMNPSVLERLLSTRRVLVLPDVSGFQQTDSDLIDAFVKRGGVVVAFGPQIPMGRTFERDQLFGGRETDGSPPRRLRAEEDAGPRTDASVACSLAEPVERRWAVGTARVLARFEDGSPAVLANAYGNGLAIAALPSVAAFAQGCPDLLRDVVEQALRHSGRTVNADVIGLSEASDVAIVPTPTGLSVVIVNHEDAPRDVTIRAGKVTGAWVDAVTGRPLEWTSDGELRLSVAAHGMRLVELRRGGGAAR